MNCVCVINHNKLIMIDYFVFQCGRRRAAGQSRVRRVCPHGARLFEDRQANLQSLGVHSQQKHPASGYEGKSSRYEGEALVFIHSRNILHLDMKVKPWCSFTAETSCIWI